MVSEIIGHRCLIDPRYLHKGNNSIGVSDGSPALDRMSTRYNQHLPQGHNDSQNNNQTDGREKKNNASAQRPHHHKQTNKQTKAMQLHTVQ